ncbi:MAG: hypothetical protein WC307_05580 [Candidatus Nanoarchaeia archaeon]|jgi:hypothetical protein
MNNKFVASLCLLSLFLLAGCTGITGQSLVSKNTVGKTQVEIDNKLLENEENSKLDYCLAEAEWIYDTAIRLTEQEANEMRAFARSARSYGEEYEESYQSMMGEADQFEEEAKQDYLNDYNERLEDCYNLTKEETTKQIANDNILSVNETKELYEEMASSETILNVSNDLQECLDTAEYSYELTEDRIDSDYYNARSIARSNRLYLGEEEYQQALVDADTIKEDSLEQLEIDYQKAIDACQEFN